MIKLYESKITSQWRIDIPLAVRRKLQIKMGERVIFYEDKDGKVILRKVVQRRTHSNTYGAPLANKPTHT